MNFLVSSAIAANNTNFQSSSYSLIIMIILSLLIYFVIINPQQKRNKIHKKLINSISKGDEVLTNGGLIGCVVKILNNDYIFIALNNNNKVIIRRDFVTMILPKGTIKALEII